MKTDINTLRKADWSNIERDMVLRLRVLAVAARKLDANEVTDKVAQDVFLPCLELIGAFVAAVDAEDETLDQVSVMTSHDQSFEDWWNRQRDESPIYVPQWSANNDIHVAIKRAFMAGLLTMPPEVGQAVSDG